MLECWVVNGAWEFDYNITTATASYTTPGGHTTQSMKILYTAPVPADVRGYNDIIDYMNEHHALPRWNQWMARVSYTIHAVALSVRELPQRWKAARVGFVRGWNTTITPPLATDLYDDDIPF